MSVYDDAVYKQDLEHQKSSGATVFTSEHQRKNLEVFAKVKDVLPLDDIYKSSDCDMVYRFLIGKHWSVEQAVQGVREYVEMRREEKLNTIMADPFPDDLRSVIAELYGLDLDGHPILWFMPDPSIIFPVMKKYEKKELTRANLRQMEEARFCALSEGVDRCTYVMDLGKISMSSITKSTIDFIRDVMKVLQTYYPEVMRRLIICNAGWAIMTGWKMLQPFVDSRIQDKIKFYNKDPTVAYLAPFISKENVHPRYGGTGGDTRLETLLHLETQRVRSYASRGVPVPAPRPGWSGAETSITSADAPHARASTAVGSPITPGMEHDGSLYSITNSFCYPVSGLWRGVPDQGAGAGADSMSDFESRMGAAPPPLSSHEDGDEDTQADGSRLFSPMDHDDSGKGKEVRPPSREKNRPLHRLVISNPTNEGRLQADGVPPQSQSSPLLPQQQQQQEPPSSQSPQNGRFSNRNSHHQISVPNTYELDMDDYPVNEEGFEVPPRLDGGFAPGYRSLEEDHHIVKKSNSYLKRSGGGGLGMSVGSAGGIGVEDAVASEALRQRGVEGIATGKSRRNKISSFERCLRLSITYTSQGDMVGHHKGRKCAALMKNRVYATFPRQGIDNDDQDGSGALSAPSTSASSFQPPSTRPSGLNRRTSGVSHKGNCEIVALSRENRIRRRRAAEMGLEPVSSSDDDDDDNEDEGENDGLSEGMEGGREDRGEEGENLGNKKKRHQNHNKDDEDNDEEDNDDNEEDWARYGSSELGSVDRTRSDFGTPSPQRARASSKSPSQLQRQQQKREQSPGSPLSIGTQNASGSYFPPAQISAAAAAAAFSECNLWQSPLSSPNQRRSGLGPEKSILCGEILRESGHYLHSTLLVCDGERRVNFILKRSVVRTRITVFMVLGSHREVFTTADEQHYFHTGAGGVAAAVSTSRSASASTAVISLPLETEPLPCSSSASSYASTTPRKTVEELTREAIHIGTVVENPAASGDAGRDAWAMLGSKEVVNHALNDTREMEMTAATTLSGRRRRKRYQRQAGRSVIRSSISRFFPTITPTEVSSVMVAEHKLQQFMFYGDLAFWYQPHDLFALGAAVTRLWTME